jgi:hypothetical protein
MQSKLKLLALFLYVLFKEEKCQKKKKDQNYVGIISITLCATMYFITTDLVSKNAFLILALLNLFY